MKRSLCLLLALLLLGCASEFAPLDTAAYPAAPVEGDPYVRDASLPLEKRRYLMERLGLTEGERTWTEPGLSGTFPIHVPDVLAMPVYRLHAMQFSEENLQYLAEACFPDGRMTNEMFPDAFSQDELQYMIGRLKEALATYTDEMIKLNPRLLRQKEEIQETIDRYTAMLADAPATIERAPASVHFMPLDAYGCTSLTHNKEEILLHQQDCEWLSDVPSPYICSFLSVTNFYPTSEEIFYVSQEIDQNGETVIDGHWEGPKGSSVLFFYSTYNGIAVSETNCGGRIDVLPYLDGDEKPEECFLEKTPKEAAEDVKAFLHAAHIPASFGRFDLCTTPGGSLQSYNVRCNPVVDNIPVVSVMNRSPLTAPPYGEPHLPVEDETWTYTVLRFIVSGSRIVFVHWYSPIRAGEQLEADAALLPYAEVEAVAKAALSGDCPEGIIPLSASLVLRAINDPTLLHEGLLRPAWCFVYRPRSADEDVRYTLSVDAVTGEPIDFGTDLCDLKPSEIPDH